MKIFKTLLITGFLFLSFTSCSKDDDKMESTGGQENNLIGTWFVVDSSYSYEEEEDPEEIRAIKECDQNNIYTFKPGNVVEVQTYFNITKDRISDGPDIYECILDFEGTGKYLIENDILTLTFEEGNGDFDQVLIVDEFKATNLTLVDQFVEDRSVLREIYILEKQ